MQPNRFTRRPVALVDGVVRKPARIQPIGQPRINATAGSVAFSQPVISGLQTRPLPVNPARQAIPARPKPEAYKPPRKTLRQRFELPIILIIGMLGGFLAQSLWFGVPAVIAYGLYALIFKVPSRTTFALAAVALVAVSALLLFKPNMQLASNFTTYTFLLLVIGVITLTIEGRPIRRKRRQKNRR